MIRNSPAPLRRAHALIGTWEGDEFVLQNYLTGASVSLSPAVAQALSLFTNFTPRDLVIARLGGGTVGRGVARALVDSDVLLARDSDVERLDARVDETWAWSHDARFFHFSTRRTDFQDDFAAEHRQLAELARVSPPPPPFASTGGPAFALPRTRPRGGLWTALRTRRTHRRFLRRAIARDALATILEWTWGPTRVMHDPEVGAYALKTSPSGGARHPTEVYAIVHLVSGVKRGIYHYHAGNHALELMRAGDFREDSVRLCANQPWLADAAAVFVMTAVVARSMWKYRQSHAYRVLLLDMGHLGQTFHLVCTALGLAPFTSAATNQAAVEKTLGLDPAREAPLYVGAVGHPARATRTLPR